MKRNFYCILMCLLFLISGIANAQVTSTSINGKVTAEDGAVIGATVQAVHQPSGTRYSAMTNEKGRYFIQGMRVGGPYKITISYVGYQTKEFNKVQLSLGQSSAFNANLTSNNNLSEVVVKANGPKNSGAGTNFDEAQISLSPTIDRNIYDIAKMDPQVNVVKTGGISIAGANNRYNSFQIDGMVSNDVFGLAGSGTNGGQTGANPISLDAIEQIQVVVSPFDVRQSGFTGGAINAITKSGTNKFKASAYGFYNDQGFYGTWSQTNNKKQKVDEQKTKIFGATLGGPIIKDKLFFFANVEYKFDSYPSSYYPEYTEDYISKAEAKAISDHYYDVTGFRDSYNPRNIDTKGLSVLGRIDWNINEKNKLALRYQLNDSYRDSYSAGYSTYYFENSGYRIKNKTNNFVAELNSHINNSLFNEARVGISFVRDNREVAYQGPCVYIKNLGGEYDDATNSWSTGNKRADIGTEVNSAANGLDQDIYTFEDNLSWYKGNHSFTFGTHNEYYKMRNLYIQYNTGDYTFDSLDDFLNDNASRFDYNYSDADLTGTNRWWAPVKAGQFGVYAQDKWNISNDFNLTYGVRFDMPVFFNDPSTNEEFNASEYSTKYGVKTGEVPSPKVMISPRAGFRWYTDEDHKTLLRGGIGLFTGRAPFVWVSNIYSNTGVEIKGTRISNNVPSFEQYANDPQAALNSAVATASKPTINTISKKFKFPQVFRVNLALEKTLPADVKMTLEGLYSKTLNNVFFENLALTDNGNKVYAVSTDDENSAAPYWSYDAGSYAAVINLRNTNRGYTYSLSAKFEKSFDFGLNLMAAYTFGHSYSVNDGTSSVAYSNWKYNYSVNPNDENEESHSKFDVPHRIMASVSYTSPKYANGLLSTDVALTYRGATGMRYCLTMLESSSSTNFNGDGWYGNSLMFIPDADELSRMRFTSEEDRASFKEWIENDSYAKKNRGHYAPRYSNLAPFEHHIDLHFAENIFYLKNRKDSKIALTLDVINFTNLLNKKWGTYYSSDYNVQPLKVSALTDDGNGNKVATYSYNDDEVYKSDFYSRWHAQVGVKVTF